MPAASWIGLSATISCIVEQFGLAIRPLWLSSASGLTSETTSGTAGSRRHLEELSTTTAPASTNRGAHSPEVEAADGVVAQGLDDRSVELLARRALGGEGDDLARGEVALPQLLAHDRADGARGADDGDAVLAHTRAPWDPKGCSASTWSAPSSKAWCSARTARSTASALTTQEILIGEVEIISMLIPSSPRVEKTLAATPGWDFMPAPTTETLPIAGSSATAAMPTSATTGSSAARAVRRSERGTVKDMSAAEPSVSGSFWMIMSTLTLASASAVKMRPAMPGWSGTPSSVTRASSRECVTAVIRGRSIVSSSPTTKVPGSSVNEERQWMRTPWLRAYSTERSCSTPAPEADISSISSKETTGSLRASGTIRGSALNTPATSV